MGSIQEAVTRIREVGITNARITPIHQSNKVKIEINHRNNWVTVIKNIDRNIAEDVLRQATNRVLLG